MFAININKSNRTWIANVSHGQSNNTRYLNSAPLSFIRSKKKSSSLNQSYQVTIEEDSDCAINSPVDINSTLADIDDKSSDNDSNKDVSSCKYNFDSTSVEYSVNESVNCFSVEEAYSQSEVSQIHETNWKIDSVISEQIKCGLRHSSSPVNSNLDSNRKKSQNGKVNSKAFKKQFVRLSSENIDLELPEVTRPSKSLLSQLISDYEPNLSLLCDSRSKKCSQYEDTLLFKNNKCRKKYFCKKESKLGQHADYEDPEESLDFSSQKVYAPIDECSPEKTLKILPLSGGYNSQINKKRHLQHKVTPKLNSLLKSYHDISPDVSLKVDYSFDVVTPEKELSSKVDNKLLWKLNVASSSKVKRKLKVLIGDSDESDGEMPKKVCVPILDSTPEKVHTRKSVPKADSFHDDSEDSADAWNSSITIAVGPPESSLPQDTTLAVQKPFVGQKRNKLTSDMFYSPAGGSDTSFCPSALSTRAPNSSRAKTSRSSKNIKPLMGNEMMVDIVSSPHKDCDINQRIISLETPEKSNQFSDIKPKSILNQSSSDTADKIFKCYQGNQISFAINCGTSENLLQESSHVVSNYKDPSSHQNSFDEVLFNSPLKEAVTKQRSCVTEKDNGVILSTPDKENCIRKETIISDTTPEKSTYGSVILKQKLCLKRDTLDHHVETKAESFLPLYTIDQESELLAGGSGYKLNKLDLNSSAFKVTSTTPRKNDLHEVISQEEELNISSAAPICEESSPKRPYGFNISIFHSPEKVDLSVMDIPIVQIPGLTPMKHEPPKIENLVFISKNKRKTLKNGSLVGRALNVINAYRVSKKLHNYELEVGLKSSESFFMSDEMMVLRTWSLDNISYIKCKLVNLKCDSTIVFMLSELPQVHKGSKIIASFPLKVFTSHFPFKVLALTDRIHISGSSQIPPVSNKTSVSSSSSISDMFDTSYCQNSPTYFYFTDFSITSIEEAAVLCNFRSSISFSFELIKYELLEWGYKCVLFDGTLYCLLNLFCKNDVNKRNVIGVKVLFENVRLLGMINVESDNILCSLNCTNPEVKWVFHFCSNKMKCCDV